MNKFGNPNKKAGVSLIVFIVFSYLRGGNTETDSLIMLQNNLNPMEITAQMFGGFGYFDSKQASKQASLI